MPATFGATLLRKIRLTADLLELHFSKPSGFEFRAGQFVQFQIPTVGEGAGFLLRSFSIASAPADENLEFCVKILAGGVASKYFSEMPVGAAVNFVGPAGRFTCDSDRDCVFVATGAGLAPIMAQIRHQLEDLKTDRRLVLLFGVKTVSDIFWTDRLDALASKFPNFPYFLTLSRPDESWTGLTGHVTEHLPANLAGQDFYLCGSPAMVQEARGLLLAGGAGAGDIHFEIF